MNAIFTLIFSSLVILSVEARQPDCNHESLQEARDRELQKHH